VQSPQGITHHTSKELMQMDDSIAKFALQAQATVQTKPQATAQVPAKMQASFDRLSQWIDDFDRNRDQYLVDVHRYRGKRKGQVTVSIPFPATPPSEGLTLIFTVTLTKDEVRQLAKVPPWVFAHVMPRQLARAAYELFPPGPKRKSRETRRRWVASAKAKKIYPNIKWLYEHEQYQPPWFKDLYEAVKQTNVYPEPNDITAWVIERLFSWWEECNLCKPTELKNFAQSYIYSATPRVRDRDIYTADELGELIRPLLAP
jgi:hypothetical protein